MNSKKMTDYEKIIELRKKHLQYDEDAKLFHDLFKNSTIRLIKLVLSDEVELDELLLYPKDSYNMSYVDFSKPFYDVLDIYEKKYKLRTYIEKIRYFCRNNILRTRKIKYQYFFIDEIHKDYAIVLKDELAELAGIDSSILKIESKDIFLKELGLNKDHPEVLERFEIFKFKDHFERQ